MKNKFAGLPEENQPWAGEPNAQPDSPAGVEVPSMYPPDTQTVTAMYREILEIKKIVLALSERNYRSDQFTDNYQKP